MSGIPASGKSTLGKRIATALGLPVLDKDDFLEALYESHGIGDGAWRRKLSRTADEMLKERTLSLESSVITSWWRHPQSPDDSGTPIEWLSALEARLIEVHCVCPPHIAAERFLSRTRHKGHLDHLKTRAEILGSFEQQAALGPLGVGSLVEIETHQDVDGAALVSEIAYDVD